MRYLLLLLVLLYSLYSLAACESSSSRPPSVTNHNQIINAALLRDPGTGPGSWPLFGENSGHTGFADPALHASAIKGTMLWSKKFGPIFSSSVAGWGKLYVSSTNGYLYALKQETGDVVWRVPTGGHLTDATPALEGRVVFVSTYSTSIEALDGLTGHVYWTFNTGEKIQAPPLAVGGKVLVASLTTLWTLDAASGQLRWKFHHSAAAWPTISAPTLIDDTVFYGSGGETRIWALRLSDGGIKWSFNTGDRIMSAPLGGRDSIYVATWHGTVFCLNRTNGQVRWSYTLNQNLHQSVIDGVGASMALANGRLYVGDYRGGLLCIEVVHGKLLWRYATGAEILATPIVAGELVYVGSDDGNFYALDTHTGRPKWRYQTGEVRCAASFANNQLYVGSINGVMYAFV